jgi:spermidine synthase
VTSQQGTVDPKTTVFLLGVATVVAQALLLREAMAAMGGSEFAWGTVMALWLLGMGLGSRIGIALGSVRLATLLPALCLVLCAGGVVLFRAAPALTGAASGETITTASAAWLWAAAVIPAAFAGGLAFPILAGSLGQSGGGRAYAVEASGALAGGILLSAFLIGFGSVIALIWTFGLVVAATIWRRSRVLALCVVITVVWLAPATAQWLAMADWHLAGNPGGLRDWRETRQQRLEANDGFPTTVYADGRLLASYPDPYEVLPRAHLTMLLHPDPRRVLAVGCVADGSLEAMVRHPVDRLVVVEEDPMLLRALPEWYGARIATALADSQVETVNSDPLRAVSKSGPWDLVILRDSDPTTIRRNRTRTLEFLRSCRANMRSDGILVMRVGVSDTYLGGAAGRLLVTLASTVREVFPKIAAMPGSQILLVAGGPDSQVVLDPDRLAERLVQRGLESSELIPEMIPLFVDPERAAALSPHLAGGQRINTLHHPRAVMLAAGLHEARARPALMRVMLAIEGRSPLPLLAALGVAAFGLMAMALVRRPPVATTAAAVGFGSMGWWLLLIATWQATRGSVFSEIGALTAIFMAGLAAGAGIACRWSRPECRLSSVLGVGAVLSLAIAAGFAVHLPLVTVPVLLCLGGGLTGAAFPGLTALSGSDSRRGAGLAFAADETGAAAGALIVGVVAIPWAGLTAVACGLAVLQLAAIPSVIISVRRG